MENRPLSGSTLASGTWSSIAGELTPMFLAPPLGLRDLYVA
jgi:hypothetical protein